jgi:hypothetical protein
VWDGQQYVESECGAPGSLHACECRGRFCGSCDGALCWSSDQCFIQPGGGCISGSCVPTVCATSGDCREPAQLCEDGRCCVPPVPEGLCRIEGIIDLPCCLGAICSGEPGMCCLPAGEPCVHPSGVELQCCSGSCTSGVCD